jgi:hypothetical protein
MRFIECESLSINFNVMGIATINYTIITNSSDFDYETNISAGGQTFNGIVTNIDVRPIPNTEYADDGPWYTNNVTLVATT